MNILKEKDELTNESIPERLKRNVLELIEKENIELEYSFEECEKAFCETHNVNENDFIDFMIELGIARHIVSNIKNFKYYGYKENLEKVRKGE